MKTIEEYLNQGHPYVKLGDNVDEVDNVFYDIADENGLKTGENGGEFLNHIKEVGGGFELKYELFGDGVEVFKSLVFTITGELVEINGWPEQAFAIKEVAKIEEIDFP